jgi:hypothetical protein
VDVGELMLGIIAVGLIAGIVVGRNTERARRSFKDWGTAKAAVPKYKTTFMTEMKRAIVTVLALAAVVAGVVFIAYTRGDS